MEGIREVENLNYHVSESDRADEETSRCKSNTAFPFVIGQMVAPRTKHSRFCPPSGCVLHSLLVDCPVPFRVGGQWGVLLVPCAPFMGSLVVSSQLSLVQKSPWCSVSIRHPEL